MKLSAEISRRLQWLQLPGALLVLLLQRTPALRVVATAGDVVLRSPATALLKYVASALGAMGAVHSLAGATVFTASPASPTTATVGTTKTVVLSVSGAPGPVGSWTIGGTVPPGMTFNGGATSGILPANPSPLTNTLTLTGVPTTAGTYTFTWKAWELAAGKGNSSSTFNYTITVSGGAVATAPSITTQPTSQTVTAGAAVSFTVAASGSPTPTYQWQKNGSALAGQTGTTLSLSNVQAADAGSYTCVATNSAGSATSSAATLTVNAAAVAPAITTQPTSQTVTAGATVSFTVAASGSPTPTYQWQKAGSPLAGKTSATLSLTNVQTADAGSYTCVATNSAGSATSSAATLTVNAAAVAPAITTQPSSQTVTAGAAVSFTVAASGSPTPTYQWQKNGSALAGQTGTTLSLTNVQAADAGSYTCVATNSAGSATSSGATLTVNAATVAPAFATQPASQSIAPGATATFTVVATGTPTPTYQWQKGSSPLAGQTAATLSLSNVQAADAGSYTCVATNTAGTATSSAATLTVSALPVAPAFTTQPASQSVAPAATATFTVVATGTPTPTYQWQKGGSPLAGQTAATLALSNVQAADAGSYTCVATNSAGTATSSAATLTVSALPVAPAFTTQPTSQSVAPGVSVTFTVVATGTPTPTYQWQKGGSPLAGQTAATLSLSNVLAADAGSYTCVATNTAGTATSSAATLTVSGVLPAFTTQPASQSVAAGASVTLTVVATGTPAPTYQWQKNGAAISGQTGATLSLSNVQVADGASYTCVATNTTGSTTSSAAVLTVVALPVFTIQPASQAAQTGSSVTLTVAVSGNAPTTYQWRKNGTPISGQTGASLALSNLQAADAAAYSCVATNSAGSTTSSTANLTVSASAVAPAFTTQPAAQTASVGYAATFSAVATGSPAPTFQWQKNGVALAGQTSSTLVLASVQAGDAGTYVCVATNSAGTATSAGAVLTVGSNATPPVFALQPASQTATIGSTVTLTASATCSPAATYQWSKNGVVLPGQNTATLTLASVDAAAAGNYVCTATNPAGTATSSIAALTVSTAAAVTSMISNVSVRTTLDAGQTLFVGFTMQGGAKPVLVRAVGPGLGNFGVAGAMSDPKLAIYRGADMLTSNDNWGGTSNLSNAFASVGAFPLTPTSMDAALMRPLEGGHTAQITGTEAGNVLVEAYDAGTGAATRLTNVSARNRVGTGADILIAGFTIGGTGSKKLLVRAVGPTLADFGVPGTLARPKLEIYNGAGERIAINESWSASLSAAFSSVGAFALTPGSADAALTISLPAGGYTVQVSGADGGTGEALVELYELP